MQSLKSHINCFANFHLLFFYFSKTLKKISSSDTFSIHSEWCISSTFPELILRNILCVKTQYSDIQRRTHIHKMEKRYIKDTYSLCDEF